MEFCIYTKHRLISLLSMRTVLEISVSHLWRRKESSKFTGHSFRKDFGLSVLLVTFGRKQLCRTQVLFLYSFFFSTFKLVPKNVPPEALQDAKGVVFSCDSDADVEKWCDVLNKAALGFIIQPSPLPEKG